ncbi:MAG TPA: metalloregulator ArsR/SmtB family transcription factor [Bacillota bacterium]|nr:metalloregulator ArsR/SmtB family transcription factor [Bacillota bacterium]
MEKFSTDAVRILKALADETRLEIINMLSGGEMCACKILENFDITQPTLSYHMRILTDCGLIDAKRDGAWIRYTLNKDAFELVRSLFSGICESLNQGQRINCCK